MKKIFLFISIVFVGQIFPLEIDEKLTTRFLKVSSSKKTVLLNRGLEDGLVVGDHAKFFLTTGVIARGVVVKASPTRTIWSIYRIVNDNAVFPDKVVNIKITKPIDTTEDPSKSLYDNSNATMTAGTEVMTIRGDSPPRVKTIENERSRLSREDRDDLATLVDGDKSMTMIGTGINENKTIEVYGLLHLNSLTSEVDEGEGDIFTGNNSTIDFSLGIEKYFNMPGSFLERVSFSALIHRATKSVTSVQGSQINNEVTEFGVGAFYHYIAPPLSYGRIIGFSGLSLGVGSVSDTFDLLSATSTQTSQTVPGSSSFLSVATGIKYFTRGGFGARAILDYYQRSESYEFENGDNFTKSVTGPRLMLGLSYRF